MNCGQQAIYACTEQTSELIVWQLKACAWLAWENEGKTILFDKLWHKLDHFGEQIIHNSPEKGGPGHAIGPQARAEAVVSDPIIMSPNDKRGGPGRAIGPPTRIEDIVPDPLQMGPNDKTAFTKTVGNCVFYSKRNICVDLLYWLIWHWTEEDSGCHGLTLIMDLDSPDELW